MTAHKHFMALAIAALIAGCGGGEQASVTPQGAAAAMKAQAQAAAKPLAAAVSADAAAEQLLNFAEASASLHAYFPSHQATQSFAPFKFRYYPETGIYLGVVVTAGMGYTLNGVYVAGAFGATLANPLYVGLVTDFITPTGGGTGGGTASECFDLALFNTQGTQLEVNYNYSGTITGTEKVTTVVGAITNFEGHQARETTATTTGSHMTQGVSTTINSTGKSYATLSGSELTEYGSIFDFSTVASGFTFTTNIKTVFNPPAVSHMYTLAQGQSATDTNSGSSTTTSHTGFGPDTVNTASFSTSTTYTYVGQESVAVPAGTYSACKFTLTSDGTASSSWFMLGKGALLKTTLGGSTPQTIEATSLKLNGAAL